VPSAGQNGAISRLMNRFMLASHAYLERPGDAAAHKEFWRAHHLLYNRLAKGVDRP
jgi:hypothetical protein